MSSEKVDGNPNWVLLKVVSELLLAIPAHRQLEEVRSNPWSERGVKVDGA